MDCGQRLLGFLELSGVVLFTAGLAVRAVVQKLNADPVEKPPSITGSRVLILGANKELGCELMKQLVKRGCQVAYAAPERYDGTDFKYFRCDSSDPKKLEELTTAVGRDFGELDILVYAAEAANVFYKEAIDEVVDMLDKNLVEHFHVVTKFVPSLSRRSGRFVTIEPQRNASGSFSVTNLAITALSDTLLQQMAHPGSGIKVTRAMRRTRRKYDRENVEESAEAILNAVEAGRSSVTLPTVKQHIKNTLRHFLNELLHLWNETTRLNKLES